MQRRRSSVLPGPGSAWGAYIPETDSAEAQVLAMNCGEPVGDERDANLVVGSAPDFTAEIAAQFERVVDLGVRERFVLAIVPPAAREEARDAEQLLHHVHSEAGL